MRYLITGGAGFLGAALANRLVRDGHDVRVIDDLSAGDNARLDGRVSFTEGDVTNVPGLWPLLQGVACVYHLAARVHVQESVEYPSEYNAINVGGTVSVLEAMRDAGVQRVGRGLFRLSANPRGTRPRRLERCGCIRPLEAYHAGGPGRPRVHIGADLL